MKTNKKKTILLASTALIVIVFLSIFYIKSTLQASFTLLDDMNSRIEALNETHNEIKSDLEVKEELSSSRVRKVLFTNYGLWDSHSTYITASGLTIDDFEINDDLMFTYQGFVVLATANTTRLNRPLYSDYKSHELYEIVEFVINEKTFKGIVIDVCGACFGVVDEEYQRYDIFTTQNIVGKVEGFIYE